MSLPETPTRVVLFLSTLSLRRATVNGDVLSSCFVNFYPRSPCGERRPNPVSIVIAIIISIHALLAESDNLRVVDGSKSSIISIHALLAESDVTVLGIQHKVGISIHALLAESDSQQPPGTTSTTYFYPRSPCGERPQTRPLLPPCFDFYPRSPCGERLYCPRVMVSPTLYFYPRSPCGERLCWVQSRRRRSSDFYPRSPCGERPVHFDTLSALAPISIHALLAESDLSGTGQHT